MPTDASVAPSGVNTPATSASDSETVKKTREKKNKRKRENKDDTGDTKKMKSKKVEVLGDENVKKLAKKIAKLSVDEKITYEKRAAAKGQTLEEYVARRIQKKNDQRATR